MRGRSRKSSPCARTAELRSIRERSAVAEVAVSEFDKTAMKRVNRAIQTARECASADPGLADIRLARFHRAMDELQSREEGEAVYDALRGEGWYEQAAAALARAK